MSMLVECFAEQKCFQIRFKSSKRVAVCKSRWEKVAMHAFVTFFR